MVSWGEFALAAPEIAGVLAPLLEPAPIVYLATVRKGGAPRVHPVCPIFANGRLLVAVPAGSPKGDDLARDGRFALHALPGPRDDEFYLTGRAAQVTGAVLRTAAAEAAGHVIHQADRLFELGVEYAMSAYWENTGQPGTYPVRQVWKAP